MRDMDWRSLIIGLLIGMLVLMASGHQTGRSRFMGRYMAVSAGNSPDAIFVVDAYTHRILSRHNLIPEACDYQTIHDLFMDNLDHDAAMFNQYHALLVRTAKQFCKKGTPLCAECPLEPLL